MTAAVLADDDFVGRWSAAIPLGRFGRPDDIADVITFLLSRRSRWITGQVIAVDGGASLRVEPKIGPDEDWTLPAIQRLVAADGAGDPEPAGQPARNPQPRPGGWARGPWLGGLRARCSNVVAFGRVWSCTPKHAIYRL
jgi:Enoyl-(Acyl carrier protein) reductase